MSAVLAVLLNVFFVVAAIGSLLLFTSYQRRKRDGEWGGFAVDRGLQYDAPGFLEKPEIRGRIDGRPVLVTTVSRSAGKSQVTYTTARAQIDAPLPQGLSITREGLDTAVAKFFGGQDIQIGDARLDRELRVKGQLEEEVQAALSDPALRELLWRLTVSHRYTRVEKTEVVVEKRGVANQLDLGGLLDFSNDLAAALAVAFRAPWRALADKHHLSMEEHGAATLLDGRIDDFPVSIRVDRAARQPETRIRVSLPRPLPGQIELGLKHPQASGGVGLGDPVLDSMLVASSSDPGAPRRLIAAADPTDDLHGHLLGVLHGHPRSTVSAGEIVLRAEGVQPATIEELLRLAVGLARGLDHARQRASGHSGSTPERLDDAERRRAAARGAAAGVSQPGHHKG